MYNILKRVDRLGTSTSLVSGMMKSRYRSLISCGLTCARARARVCLPVCVRECE